MAEIIVRTGNGKPLRDGSFSDTVGKITRNVENRRAVLFQGRLYQIRQFSIGGAVAQLFIDLSRPRLKRWESKR